MELRYEIYIGANPDKVWESFMSPEGVRKIFYGCKFKSTGEVGDSFQYVGPGHDGDETIHLYGHILAYEQGKIVSLLEHPGPSYQPRHAELQSRITFSVEPIGECTKLTLVNDQWTSNHPTYENTKATWPIVLSNIKSLAETGKTLELE